MTAAWWFVVAGVAAVLVVALIALMIFAGRYDRVTDRKEW